MHHKIKQWKRLSFRCVFLAFQFWYFRKICASLHPFRHFRLWLYIQNFITPATLSNSITTLTDLVRTYFNVTWRNENSNKLLRWLHKRRRKVNCLGKSKIGMHQSHTTNILNYEDVHSQFQIESIFLQWKWNLV